jgi:hypothetical protein
MLMRHKKRAAVRRAGPPRAVGARSQVRPPGRSSQVSERAATACRCRGGRAQGEACRNRLGRLKGPPASRVLASFGLCPPQPPTSSAPPAAIPIVRLPHWFNSRGGYRQLARCAAGASANERADNGGASSQASLAAWRSAALVGAV